MAAIDCPCGTELGYADCCGVIHERGAGLGATAVALMRARYTAYVRNDGSFLVDSWHHDSRPENVTFESPLVWLGLDIIETVGGGGLDNEGIVEFRARYKLNDEQRELHERSRFVRVSGYWRYVDAL